MNRALHRAAFTDPSCNPDESLAILLDVAREPITLGGALILRQEAELLARWRGESEIPLFITGDEECRTEVDRIASLVFGSSSFNFSIRRDLAPLRNWPTESDRAQETFSYFSFERVAALHETTGIPPHLSWSPTERDAAKATRAEFRGRLICVHLRSVAPFSFEQSNAPGQIWDAFFAQHACPGTMDFLLIGNDPLPAALALRPGVSRTVDRGLALPAQLALVGIAEGFMGMASGVSASATLSGVPHVIFKHPAHHAVEITRELGNADHFRFAGARQKLWRRAVSLESLNEALALIVA